MNENNHTCMLIIYRVIVHDFNFKTDN